MSSIRFGVALALAVMFVASPAFAQRVVPNTPKPPGASGTTGSSGGSASGGTSGSSLPQASLTPSVPVISAPPLTIVDTSTFPVARAAGPAPPPACYPRSQSDCASDAAQCLAREYINDNYEIQWDAAGPYINRTYWTSDTDQSSATGCANDLQRCLTSGC